ncbi:MAG: discoidin domain-containing protein [Victivallales bacterium]|nr:discoidin domain-containing protein [Victivallales bacterium]
MQSKSLLRSALIFLLAAIGALADEVGAFMPRISWEGYKGKAVAAPAIKNVEGPDGIAAIHVEPVAKGDVQGAIGRFAEPVDLGKYGTLELNLRHNITGKNGGKQGMVFMTTGKGGRNHCEFVVPSREWGKVLIPLDTSSFKAQRGNSVNLSGVAEFRLYPFRALNEPGKFFEVAGLKLWPKTLASRSLKIMNYQHLAEPTSGESGNVLADGNKEKNVFFRPYSAEPDIVFDLGGRFTVDEIKIYANCAPSHNFSEIAVQVSFDKENWIPAGVIYNKEQGTTRRQVVYAYRNEEKPIVGRYVRFSAMRLRSDHTVELSEVEFTGHTVTAEELVKAAESNYDIGPKMPPRSEKDYVKLSSGSFELWISRENGVVNGLFHKSRLLAERIAPQYTMQTREKDTAVDGNLDKVENITANKDGSVTVTVSNEKLPGVKLRRTWSVEGNALMEKVEVLADKGLSRYFLRIATEVILQQGFRKDGFYDMPGSAIAMSMLRIPAKDVQMPRSLTNIPTIAFENASVGLTIWHTRFRSNGRFTYMDVGTEEENLQFFKPNGWMITAVTLVPADAPVQSVENRLSVTEGGMIKAYDEYIAHPDVAAFRRQIKRPAWLRDLRCDVTQGWDASYPGSSQRHFTNMTEAFSPRGYLHECAMFDMDGIWGDLPISGEIIGSFGSRCTAEELQAKVRRLRAINPNFKLGYYTWFWSAYPWSTPVQKHPEWFVKTLRSGAKASWFPGTNVNYLRFWGIPASRQEAQKQIVDFVNYYEQDNWYLDGGKSGAYAKDWDTMRIDDPLGQTDFYLGVRKAIKEGHPDRVVYFNHSENPLGDIGYLESFGGTLTSEWRRGAMLMWKFKLYNYKDPLHHSVYIYWLPGVDGAFHNYMSGIGVVGSYDSRSFNTRDLPFIAARYEIRQAQLAEADIKPDWRNDANEELELMALHQGNNGWLFINPHETGKTEREVSVLTAPLGLVAKDKPIYAWLYTIKNGKSYNALFSERQIARDYQKTGWIAERAVVPQYMGTFPYTERFSCKVSVQQGQAKVLMLSQLPAVVLSVADEPSHYYLAGQPGSVIKEDKGRIVVESEENAEIGILLDEGRAPASATINGKNAPVALRIEKNMRFAVLMVAKGRNEIALNIIEGSTPVAKKLDAALKERNLKVDVEPSNASVQIYSEGNLVLSKAGSFALDLPETVRDGKYQIVSGKISKVISLKKLGKPMKLRPILIPLEDKAELKPVNRTVNGIKVISQGSLHSEQATFASVDVDKLQLSTGTLRVFENHFNRASAMLELEAKRYLKLRMDNGFWYYNNYGYQPKRHSVRPARPNVFGGLVLDFATREGYTVRSAAGLGIQNEKRDSMKPLEWGTKSKQQNIYVLDNLLIDENAKSKECWIDLATLGAPEGWTGRLCFASYFEDIAPARSFSVEILETADILPAGATALKPVQLGVHSTALLEIKTVKGNPDWAKMPVLGELTAAKASMVQLRTQVKAAYNDECLYFFYDCAEKPEHIQNNEGSRINKPWQGDGVEFFVGRTDNTDMIFHVVIDVANTKYIEDAMLVKQAGAKNIEKPGTKVSAKFNKSKGGWTVVLTIPWSEIGGRPETGVAVPFNLMRNRLEEGKFGHYTLVPGGMYFSGRQYQFKLAK